MLIKILNIQIAGNSMYRMVESVVRCKLTRQQRYELYERRIIRTRLKYDSYQR